MAPHTPHLVFEQLQPTKWSRSPAGLGLLRLLTVQTTGRWACGPGLVPHPVTCVARLLSGGTHLVLACWYLSSIYACTDK